MADFKMEQGCTYKPRLSIEIEDKNKLFTNEDVAKVKIVFGNLLKVYPSDDVKYEDGEYIINLTSRDTLNIPAGREYKIKAIAFFRQGEKKPVDIAETFEMIPTGLPSEVLYDE